MNPASIIVILHFRSSFPFDFFWQLLKNTKCISVLKNSNVIKNTNLFRFFFFHLENHFVESFFWKEFINILVQLYLEDLLVKVLFMRKDDFVSITDFQNTTFVSIFIYNSIHQTDIVG